MAYFHGIEPGKYLATWPFYIIGDDQSNLTFKVAVDDTLSAFEYSATSIKQQVADVSDSRRAYLTSSVESLITSTQFSRKSFGCIQITVRSLSIKTS